jgi:hypothetical protein
LPPGQDDLVTGQKNAGEDDGALALVDSEAPA